MDNIFKNNGRFSVLLDDTASKQKNDNNKNYNDKKYNDKDIVQENTKKYNLFKKTQVSSKSEVKKEINLEEMNFPDLIDKQSRSAVQNKCELSFSTKIKETPLITTKLYDISDEVKPGWLLLKKNNNDILRIYKKDNTVISDNKKLEEVFNDEPKEFDYLAAAKALSDLYEKRKRIYIQLWGEEEYDKLFKMQNYDYEYFDKLDEKYEAEMNELSDSDSEYEYVDDYYNN
jgi:hypothetical protein